MNIEIEGGDNDLDNDDDEQIEGGDNDLGDYDMNIEIEGGDNDSDDDDEQIEGEINLQIPQDYDTNQIEPLSNNEDKDDENNVEPSGPKKYGGFTPREIAMLISIYR